MKLPKALSVKEIARLLDAQLIGDGDLMITDLNVIHKVSRGSLIFVNDDKYLNPALYSTATAVLLKSLPDSLPPNKALLLVERPFEAYNYLAQQFLPFQALEQNRGQNLSIGKGTIIEQGVVLGNEVEIGEDCIIRANTVILDRVKIGNRVIIQSNSVIGSDAFYFEARPEGGYQRWHSIGTVIIEDEVELGAGCTVDRGLSGPTIIGYGSKLDNQVHVGHGVKMGRHCLVAAQVGIAGSVTIQDHVVIFGQVGISKEVVIGENAVLLSQTGVSKSLPGAMQYFGTPASEARSSFRELAALRQLPDLLKWWQKKLEEEGGKA